MLRLELAPHQLGVSEGHNVRSPKYHMSETQLFIWRHMIPQEQALTLSWGRTVLVTDYGYGFHPHEIAIVPIEAWAAIKDWGEFAGVFSSMEAFDYTLHTLDLTLAERIEGWKKEAEATPYGLMCTFTVDTRCRSSLGLPRSRAA